MQGFQRFPPTNSLHLAEIQKFEIAFNPPLAATAMVPPLIIQAMVRKAGETLRGDFSINEKQQCLIKLLKLRNQSMSPSNTKVLSDELSSLDVKGVFTRLNLANTDLSSLDLSGFNFSGSDMRGCNLSNSNLNGTNMSGVNLSLATLAYVDLTNTIFNQTTFSRNNLYSATLRGEIYNQIKNQICAFFPGSNPTDNHMAMVCPHNSYVSIGFSSNITFKNSVFTWHNHEAIRAAQLQTQRTKDRIMNPLNFI